MSEQAIVPVLDQKLAALRALTPAKGSPDDIAVQEISKTLRYTTVKEAMALALADAKQGLLSKTVWVKHRPLPTVAKDMELFEVYAKTSELARLILDVVRTQLAINDAFVLYDENSELSQAIAQASLVLRKVAADGVVETVDKTVHLLSAKSKDAFSKENISKIYLMIFKPAVGRLTTEDRNALIASLEQQGDPAQEAKKAAAKQKQ